VQDVCDFIVLSNTKLRNLIGDIPWQITNSQIWKLHSGTTLGGIFFAARGKHFKRSQPKTVGLLKYRTGRIQLIT